jgi:two-component system nitrate/nitrite sensor histidine kinase NarX
VTGACQAESVVETDCGTCGKSATKRSLETSNVDVCKQRYGEAFFGDKCQFVLAVPFGDRETGEEPAGVITLFFANEKSMLAVGRPVVESYAGLIQVALQCVWKNEDKHQGNLLDERQSIANEIHDSLAQTLYFAKIRTSLLLDAMKSQNDLLAFKCAQDIDEALESSQKTVRELVTHFRCQMDPKGLRFALQKLVNDFVARTNIRLDYVNRIDDLELPNEYELQVFLIIRESLVNIATHSGATIAGLTISLEDAQYQFVVEDNGAGVGDVAPLEGHYGLEIMRERALRIGGEVKVTSLEGQGTRVELSFSAPQD